MKLQDLFAYIDETASIANFAGAKFTDYNLGDYLSCLHYKNSKYDVLYGRDEQLLSALAIGAKGFIGSTYNYLGDTAQEIIDSYEKGEKKKAQETQLRLVHVVEELSAFSPDYNVGKEIMAIRGVNCGAPRLPELKMPEHVVKELQEKLQKHRV